MKSYAERLNEISATLEQADGEERNALVAEAQSIAHNLAGTAAMFGSPALGDLAAEISEHLQDEGAKAAAEARIKDLWEALKQAA